MRWPIHVQLLLPILLVVVVALATSSVISAYFGSRQVRGQQEEDLRRVIRTLTRANFPLTERVLEEVSGLSGADLVLFDEQGQIQAATLSATRRELEALRRIPAQGSDERLSVRHGVNIGGHTYLSHRVPVARRPGGRENASLAVLYREDLWQESARQAAYPALIAGGGSAIAAVLAASFLARRFVRPLRLLGDQTATIANGSFRCVAVPRRNDEIRDLALCINGMAEKLGRYESEVRRNERLWTLGQLGAGMAHQLRNSATGARMDIELHQRECPMRRDNGQPLQVALRQLRLMESYLQRFLSLGRSGAVPHEKVAVGELLQDALELVRPACGHNRVELDFHRPHESLYVWGDADSLRELLVNLLLNAMEAARRNAGVPPRVVVECERHGADRVTVRVKDSGPGLAPEIQERLYEAFASQTPGGIGLGLFVARRIVEAHQGLIGWERQDNMTCFAIELPLMPPDMHHGPPAGC